MMEDLSKAFFLLAAVFLVMGLLLNISGGNLPRIPGDIYIDRPGMKVYIPVVSAIVISVLLSLLFNFFRK